MVKKKFLKFKILKIELKFKNKAFCYSLQYFCVQFPAPSEFAP